MRRLILLRHAKSDHPPGIADHDRPLAPRGITAAPLMGRYLKDENLLPDLALVSTARRTQQTWDLASAEWSETIPAHSERGIYEASADRLLDIIKAAPDEARSLIVIGHNPGFHDLAMMLVGHGDRYAFARLQANMPTAALTIIDFAVDGWADVAPREGRLDRFITPKMLGGIDEH